MSNLELMLSKYDTVVICEYCGRLAIVPCNETQSGYYPDYKLASSYDIEQEILFPMFIDNYNIEHSIDGIMFTKTDNGIQIHCIEDTWDGFQVITEERQLTEI